MSILRHMFGGLQGVFAFIPVRFMDGYRDQILALSKSWITNRCSRLTPSRYACAIQSCALSSQPKRIYRSYLFGPLGWSGGPPDEPEESDLDFMGIRLDLLLRKKKSYQRDAIAHEKAHERQTSNAEEKQAALDVITHEMAHERQRFCKISDGRERWPKSLFRRVWQAEYGAAREVIDFLENDDRPLAAFANRVASAMRVPASAVFAHRWLRRLLFVLMIVLFIRAARQAIQTFGQAKQIFTAPWDLDRSTLQFFILVCFLFLLIFGFLVIILYRFLRGVNLSRYYELHNEAH